MARTKSFLINWPDPTSTSITVPGINSSAWINQCVPVNRMVHDHQSAFIPCPLGFLKRRQMKHGMRYLCAQENMKHAKLIRRHCQRRLRLSKTERTDRRRKAKHCGHTISEKPCALQDRLEPQIHSQQQDAVLHLVRWETTCLSKNGCSVQICD